MQIKEAYCSFDVAKLLKEKGFKEFTLEGYDIKGKELDRITPFISWNEDPLVEQGFPNFKTFAKPTHQMAMRWLREVHKLHIEIWPTYNMETEEHMGWGITVSDLSDFGGQYLGDASGYKTYEEAVEVALKESLENFV